MNDNWKYEPREEYSNDDWSVITWQKISEYCLFNTKPNMEEFWRMEEFSQTGKLSRTGEFSQIEEFSRTGEFSQIE